MTSSARASRSLLRADSALRRGTDYIEIFQSQGFDAIQGIGGFVNLSVYGSFELMHRTATMAFTQSTVFDAAGRKCAHATGTFKFVKRLPTGAKSSNPINISTD